MTMIYLTPSNKFHRWSKDAWPAFLILIFSIVVSIFLGEFTFLKGSEAICKGLFRFFRITLFLCLPLYLLLPVFGRLGRVVQRKNSTFLQIEGRQELEIRPLKHWLFRPFQGVGIGLLFATKLLGILEIISGSSTTASLFLPTGQFQLGRFLMVTGITVLVSLLLSTLWTMDDLGIRYFNRKDYEIKIVGQYVGTLMPIVFGLYGVLGLFNQFSKVKAFIYLFQVAVILYPSFTIFSIFHAHFIQKRAEDLSRRLFDKGEGNEEEGT